MKLLCFLILADNKSGQTPGRRLLYFELALAGFRRIKRFDQEVIHRLQIQRQHARLADDRHEIAVTGKAGHEMSVQVPYNPSLLGDSAVCGGST